MTTHYLGSFQKTVLATLIGLCLSPSVFALQEISDKDLSQATGEGIALLPQDFAFVLRGNGANEPVSTILNDRTKDTGYIHILPVGGLTSMVQDTNKDGFVSDGLTPIAGSTKPVDHSVGKADIYLYGLALSKNQNGDVNSRFDSNGSTINYGTSAIASWGTASNPWIFKAETKNNIPNFDPASTIGQDLTYLGLEAPLYEYVYNNLGVNTNTPETAGLDAYNLKLAFWADMFVLDQAQSPSSANLYKLGENFGSTDTSGNRANRLRLQAIMNGFSINGSNFKVFQTLDGATTAGGLSPFYNNTLGMSGLVRLNSGDSRNSIDNANRSNIKASFTQTGVERWYSANSTCASSNDSNCIQSGSGANGTWVKASGTDGNYTVADSTWNVPTGTGFGTGNGANCGTSFTNEECMYRFKSRKVMDIVTGGTWTPPSLSNMKVLRLSTRESGTGQGILDTPALSSTPVAPTFDETEGLYIYNPNINLVLGNMYQPVIFGSDGKNLSLEIARIPNKPEVYKEIYTNYDQAYDPLNPNANGGYKGSTCNVYQCGANVTLGGRTYQGSSATHSSISIGTVNYNAAKNTLEADKSNEAIGISFGQLAITAMAGKKVVRDEVAFQQRQATNTTYTVTDRYTLRVHGDDLGAFTGGQTKYHEYADPYGKTPVSCTETGGFFGGTACDSVAYRWTNTTGYHTYWSYLDVMDDAGNKSFGNKEGLVIYCNSGVGQCIAGTPKGATYVNGTTITWQSGFGPNSSADVANSAGLQNLTGVIWGIQDCWIGTSGRESGSQCWGGTSSTGGTGAFGQGSVLQGSQGIEPPTANNQSWTYNRTSLPWFDAARSSVTSDYYGVKTGITPQVIPAAVSVSTNPSPLNNLGSAVIDGVLIQHLKLTTKGL